MTQIDRALEYTKHLIEQGKTRDEALSHAAHRFGVRPQQLREHYEFDLDLAEIFRDLTDDWFTDTAPVVS